MKHSATYILTLLVVLMMSSASFAQSRRKSKVRAKAPKIVKVEKTPAQILYDNMLPATAKIMFIDSVVVDKNNFLNYLKTAKEVGQLKQEGEKISYTNELGHETFFSDGDSISGYKLYSSVLLGDGKWTMPDPVREINDKFHEARYPFVMPDGVTMFFSAKGEQSIGGYDIFMTIKDNDTGEFLTPENYGLPFNSTANDYLLVIDEYNSLGWLVSDRYQPDDMVCIYTFVPTPTRMSFESDNLTESQLQNYADIRSISDTWQFGNRLAAEDRLRDMLQRSGETEKTDDIAFVINDRVTYHSINDFKSNESKQLYGQLTELMGMFNHDVKTLDSYRDNYDKSSAAQKSKMENDIMLLEARTAEMCKDIQDLTKKIREIEINTMIQTTLNNRIL